MQFVTVRGVQIPALGLGTWKLRGADCQRAVETALGLGYRHLDTAQMYGNEAEVGAAIRASGVAPGELWVTTKIWWENLAPADVERSAAECLGRLGVPAIDLLLIHWPSRAVPLEDTLAAFQRVQKAGVCRHIGVANFPPGMLRRALDLAPSLLADQVEYHPYLEQSELLRLCRERDMTLTAYCPLGQGAILDDPVLRAIGEAHGKSPAQIILRWHLQQPNVTAIPKSVSPRHLEENLQVFDFELTPDEMDRIFALARGDRQIDPTFAPDWND